MIQRISSALTRTSNRFETARRTRRCTGRLFPCAPKPPVSYGVRHGEPNVAGSYFRNYYREPIVLSFLGKLLPKRQPKEKHFKCARCGTISRHTERTIEAWRNNKTKFFCQACHVKWLESKPPQFSSRGNAGSASGCLGVVVFFTFVSLVGYLLVRAYSSFALDICL